MYQKSCDPQILQNNWKTSKTIISTVSEKLCLHDFSKPLENVGTELVQCRIKDFIVLKKPLEEEVVRDPVQVGRRTKGKLRKINDFVAVAHAPIVSPMARDLVLHCFRKPWKTIGKTMILDNRKP